MKKMISYMVCVIGLVFVMCGSAGAVPSDDYGPFSSHIQVYTSDGSRQTADYINAHYFYFVNQSGGSSNAYQLYSQLFDGRYESMKWSSEIRNTYAGISVNAQAGDTIVLRDLSCGWGSDMQVSSTDSSLMLGQYGNVFGDLNVFGSKTVSGGFGSFTDFGSVSATGVWGSNFSITFRVPDDFDGSYILFCLFYYDRPMGITWTSSASVVSGPGWLNSLPAFSLESTQSQILSRLDVPLTSIVTAINNLSTAVGTPSAMDKFENDYLGDEHISGQLDKAQQFISPSNPGLPNGGDVGGFAEQIQNGMGFNGSSFDSEKFQQATDAFKVDSTSTGEGGMWWFFSQDVADSLAHDDAATVSDDDGQSLQDAWVEQIKRRWGNW